MPDRTDDPPRTRRQVAATLPTSRSASPVAHTSPSLPAADDHPLTWESFRAILSSHQRAGRWEPADEIQVRAFCGEVTLDFTRADLPPSGMVEIDVLAICGEVKIVVPEDAEVELDGTPILGSIEQHAKKKRVTEHIREWVTGESDDDYRQPAPTDEPPYFRIQGRAIIGTIKVTAR